MRKHTVKCNLLFLVTAQYSSNRTVTFRKAYYFSKMFLYIIDTLYPTFSECLHLFWMIVHSIPFHSCEDSHKQGWTSFWPGAMALKSGLCKASHPPNINLAGHFIKVSRQTVAHIVT